MLNTLCNIYMYLHETPKMSATQVALATMVQTSETSRTDFFLSKSYSSVICARRNRCWGFPVEFVHMEILADLM